MLAGIRPEWLIRWNGLPGTVAVGSLGGPAMAAARKILWVREPETCVAAEVPIAGADGTILFSQLDVQSHVNRSEPNYDPVAEKILINMKAEDSKWTGRIHDPDSGRNYDSTIAMKGPNLLKVQGCAFGGMFCGGQTWKRIS